MNDQIMHSIKSEMTQLLDLVQTTNPQITELGNTSNLIEQLKTSDFRSSGSQDEVEMTSLLSEVCWSYNSLRSLFHGN